MAHRHVPSRQEPLSRPRNIPGYQEWKNSATPRAWIMRGQLRFSGAPKQAISNSEAASNERHGCFPRWQFGERHGKASTCTPSLSATSPSARRQMLCSRAPPAISNTSRPVERLLAPVPVPSLSSPIDPPVLHASPLSGKGAPRFNSFLSERASDRFKEAAA